MSFSQKIKDLRIDKGLTQKALSSEIGISEKVMWTYENGKCEPSIEVLKQLADIFGVTVGYLVGSEDESGRQIDNSMTEEEQKLLSTFRALDPAQRRAILRTAESLLAENRQSQRIS